MFDLGSQPEANLTIRVQVVKMQYRYSKGCSWHIEIASPGFILRKLCESGKPIICLSNVSILADIIGQYFSDKIECIHFYYFSSA